MARSLGQQAARILLALTIIGAIVAVGARAAAAQDDAATDQRVVRLVGHYEVEPDLGRIDVVEEITVSNVRGSTRSGNTVTSYFWTGHTVWAPTDAEDLSISVDGNELEWEVAETITGIDIISADYRRNLNFGQTRVIDVTYTLPTYAPDIGGRRINEALFDFELVTCCGFEEVDLTVTIPADFAVTPANSLRFTPSVSGGRQVYSFSDNEVTGQFTELIFTNWSGFNEAGMERSTATVEGFGTPVELIHPPDDEAWADETSADIAELGAALEELIGSPFPEAGMVFRQGRNDDFGQWGTDGPFDEQLILPRDYDRRGLAATLAQAWLADGPFSDEVIRDGLAFEFASEAIARTGGRSATPSEPGSGDSLDPVGRQWVIRQIADEIGHDGLTEIVGLARENEAAYRDSDVAGPEAVATIPGDWRRFVDLAEHRLGSERVVPVFTEHVIGSVGVAQLDARSAAFEDYERLERSAGGVVPAGIRAAMTNWEFEEAEAMLAAATAVVDERERVIGDDAERAEDVDLALGESWAGAESVEDLEAVQAAILDRESELDRSRLIRFGLIGLGALALVGTVIGALLFRRRRAARSTESADPVPPAGPASGEVPALAVPTWAPPTATPSPWSGTTEVTAPDAPPAGDSSVSTPPPSNGPSPA